MLTITDRLSHLGETRGDSTALIDISGDRYSYAAIWKVVRGGGGFLFNNGVVHRERIVVVGPTGSAMALCLLSLIPHAACVPANIDLRRDEFGELLDAVSPRLVVIVSGLESEVREAANARGITVVDCPRVGAVTSVTRDPDPATPDDIALLLPTSGTTSRPKIVPLTHGNVCASAKYFSQTYGLTEQDRCLNCMPLFHVHGLMAGMLASVLNGGSTLCTPGFEASEIFSWIRTFRPTWITGVPTFYHGLLEALELQPEQSIPSTIRFLRSASASLSPVTMKRLEESFGVPVLESYAMTEAAAHISVNPPPPGLRKPGSVGLPAGPDVSVRDELGNRMATGELGEIMIRGANVISGYFGDQNSNRESFVNGWLRTGDQGYLDSQGYLYITGRFKELIVRGGYNIAPREIEEAMEEHPNVLQTVAFAVPHATLGQDVVCAVVLRNEPLSTENELREFLLDRLVAQKVPSRIVAVDEIPRAANGKIQRARLGEHLAQMLETQRVPLEGEIEKQLARIWQSTLRTDEIFRGDSFFALGGDSLLASQVAVRIHEDFGIAFSGVEVLSAMKFSILVEEVLVKMILAAGPKEVQNCMEGIVEEEGH